MRFIVNYMWATAELIAMVWDSLNYHDDRVDEWAKFRADYPDAVMRDEWKDY